jgi:hypothetical protein
MSESSFPLVFSGNPGNVRMDPINPFGGDDFENESRIIFDTPQLAAIVQVVPSGPQSNP